MSAALLVIAVVGLSPQQQLEAALETAKPPPAMRAAFRATLTTDQAVRHIQYDPYAPAGQQFFVTQSYGRDPELDAVVNDWRMEGQADSRLFADDLRSSIGEGRVIRSGDQWNLSFSHQISPKDGPVDRLMSPLMKGGLTLDPVSGQLSRITYSIERPFKLDDGTTVTEYSQTYSFAYSTRWNVAFVSSYELAARGGKWGFSESRRVKVVLTDITFALASDARQELANKPGPRISTVASR